MSISQSKQDFLDSFLIDDCMIPQKSKQWILERKPRITGAREIYSILDKENNVNDVNNIVKNFLNYVNDINSDEYKIGKEIEEEVVKSNEIN